MADKKIRKNHAYQLQPEEEIVECSSPPCLLGEFGSTIIENGQIDRRFSRQSPNDPVALQEWMEIRLWRKVKRSVMIERRLSMTIGDRISRSDTITALLMDLLPRNNKSLIGFYWPFRGEYDPRPLVRSLHDSGIRLALPVVVEKAKPLLFREWWPGIPMKHGVWNIPFPAEGESVAPELLIAPLVAFDVKKYRLGYGGGYYDRTLAASTIKPKIVGVGFEFSRIPTIYPQNHDIPMDLVVTERGVE